MRPRLCMNDGEISQLFVVTQELRKSCVRSLLTCNVFVGAAVQVVLVPRVGEYEDIVSNLAHLEDGVGRDEELLTCGQRTVGSLLFADVAVIVSKSTEGLFEKMAFTVTIRK